MLNRLYLENFKTWRKAELKFAQITGLFGTNSSGKSSLIQFMVVLKQTKEATDRAIALDLNGRFASLGSFPDAIFNHDEKLRLSWTLDITRSEPLALQDPSTSRTKYLIRSEKISVSSQVRWRSLGAQSVFLQYNVGEDQTFSLQQKKADDTAFDLKAAGSGFRFVRTPGRAWQLPGPIKSYAFPDQARTYFQNASFLADLEAAYEQQLDSIYYLGPLRDFPKREYAWARTRPMDVGVRGEKVVDAILAATIAGEKHNLQWKGRLQTFQQIVAHWLQKMGLIHSFELKEIAPGSNYYQAVLRSRPGGPKVALTDVGFGVSQVLPVIVLLYYVPAGSTVVLEQPEIHLHPLAQAELADLIANVAFHRNVQIVIETHSEHLLLRLQRRIAENSLPASGVRLYYSEATGPESELRELPIDKLGQIHDWPPLFMGDAFGETVAAEKARLKRLSKK